MTEQSIREQMSETLFKFYDHGTQPNALVEAGALLASPVIRRIQAEALRAWADFQDRAIQDMAYVADDDDRAEVSRWTVSARVYADRIERGAFAVFEKAQSEPVTVTDEMVGRGLRAWLNADTPSSVDAMRAALEAALSPKAEK